MSAAYYVCATKVDFPATEAPGVPGVLHVCTTKSRLSSHGSSACPRRTTFVLQKSTFQHGSSGCPRRTLRLYYKSRLSSHGSSACPRRTVCTTKVDFPATEAPRVRGVLRLYYKSRFSSHGSLRRTTSVLHKSTKKTQKHYGFRTATTRKPAEGLRLHVKKRKNTMVLAPRQRRNPQRGYSTFVCHKMQKHDGFGTAPTPKPAEGCLRPRKKVPNTTVLAPRPGDYPQRVVRGHKET